MRIGVVGSGIMGSGIVELAASAGHDVVLRSRVEETAHATVQQVGKSLDKQVGRERITREQADQTMDRITPTSHLGELHDCDLVIESIVEDLSTKLEMFEYLGEVCRPDAILATNTSTLPVVDMAVATLHPERVCGIHFFNPATAMKLVEIVRPITASDETMAIAVQFAESCRKDVVEVHDEAGFIVNALLFPYLNNAVKMFERGMADAPGIDTAMKGGCGFPMGPLELLDLVGLDTTVAILDALYTEFADPNYAPAPTLRRMVSAGQLGRKTGQGFHSYS